MEKSELSQKIGSRIRALRKQAGMSQTELAWLCYKDKQAIEKIENGKVNPTIYSLFLIANALKTDLDKLLKF